MASVMVAAGPGVGVSARAAVLVMVHVGIGELAASVVVMVGSFVIDGDCAGCDLVNSWRLCGRRCQQR